MSSRYLRRLRNLSVLVGRYYVRHYGLRKSSRILRVLLGHLPEDAHVPIDNLTRNYLFVTMGMIITKDLIRAINDAIHDYIRYREFKVVFDNQTWGALDVTRTVITYPSGLYAFMTYLPTSKSPEYLLLREIASRALINIRHIINWVEDIIRNSDQENKVIHELRYETNNLKKMVARLKRKINKLPASTIKYAHRDIITEIERLAPYAPAWLLDAYDAYLLSRFLGRKVYVTTRRKVGTHDLIMLGWRLYEIFIYMLILEIFESVGYKIESKKSRILRLSKNEKIINIVFNRPLSNSIIMSADSSKDLAKRVRGRPDVSIVGNEHTIVIECKFSETPTYITAGRYKVMAYMYEYNADLGILVLPGLNIKIVYDEEDKATAKLWSIIKKYGYAKISLNNNKNIYLVRIDPGEFDDIHNVLKTAKERLFSILNDII